MAIRITHRLSTVRPGLRRDALAEIRYDAILDAFARCAAAPGVGG
jgi:hypothetical protein